MSRRRSSRALTSLLAAATAWVAVVAWSGLTEAPGDYLVPAAVGALLIAVAGTGARALGLRWYAVAPAQGLVVAVWLHHRQVRGGPLSGWLPTPHGVSGLADRVREGAEQVNSLGAPIDQGHTAVAVYLLVVSLLVVLVVDLLACGLGHSAWTALPLLITLAVPISVLDEPLPWQVVPACGLLFAALLAAREDERARAWGTQLVDRPREAVARTWGGQAVGIGVLAVAAAVVLPTLVPLGPGIFDRDQDGDEGKASTVELSNPMVGLRRDLIRNDRIPLLNVRTPAIAPSYLRLTVLDTFTGRAWIPGTRSADDEVTASGQLPIETADEDQAFASESRPWNLDTTYAFRTAWLPTPEGTRAIAIDGGGWRYAPDTADVVAADRKPQRAVRYQLEAGTPDIAPEALASAGAASPEILGPMTTLPRTPPAVLAIAREVTAGATNDYERATLLQRWFRTDGGFEYSLEPAPGDGIDQLVRFITEDKVGFCQQFAAAMAVMARSLGMPARVVVGFLEPSTTDGGRYQFTSNDLHAWPEIYFRGTGWVRFEPTPSARSGAAPSWTRPPTSLPETATPTARPTTAAPSRAPSRQLVTPTTGPRGGSGGTTVPATALVAVAVLLMLAVPRAVRRSQRRRRLRRGPDGRTEVAAYWAELRATATDLGLSWPAGRSVRTTARAIAAQVTDRAADPDAWESLVTLVERAAYQRDFRLEPDERDAALATVTSWTGAMARSRPRVRSLVATWLPRSILRAGAQ